MAKTIEEAYQDNAEESESLTYYPEKPSSFGESESDGSNSGTPSQAESPAESVETESIHRYSGRDRSQPELFDSSSAFLATTEGDPRSYKEAM